MNAAAQPSEQPAAQPPKPSLWSRFKRAVLTTAAVLAALVGIVKEWNALTSLIFPAGHAPEARILGKAESEISLQEYEVQGQLPAGLQASTSAAAAARFPQTSSRYRLAIDDAPAASRPVTATFVAVTSEEGAKSQEEKIKPQSEQIKQEGEKIKEEAKREEEDAAREKAKATSEQKSAEALEQEERKKAQEAQKRAEETAKHGAPEAKAEEQKARREVDRASKTVQAKKEEARRPPSARRAEAGASAGVVEEVLREAHLPARCNSSCGLKPIVERALKTTSNDPAKAARQVQATIRSPRLGARVHFDIALYGLAHNAVALTYSLVQRNGAPPPPPYVDTVIFKTVEPTGEKEPAVGRFWVPVPSNSQEYYLQLTVYDGKREVASSDTNPFR